MCYPHQFLSCECGRARACLRLFHLEALKSDNVILEGRPNPDRTWTECFAQLVGTILSFWDAAELDAAGEDGEVLPKFINLTDASIKMVRFSKPFHSYVTSLNFLGGPTCGRTPPRSITPVRIPCIRTHWLT